MAPGATGSAAGEWRRCEVVGATAGAPGKLDVLFGGDAAPRAVWRLFVLLDREDLPLFLRRHGTCVNCLLLLMRRPKYRDASVWG